MKSLYSLILGLVLSACAADTRRAADINWPADPAQRRTAERYLETADDSFGNLPAGMAFVSRGIDEKSISDHFDYALARLNRQQTLEALRGHVLDDFFDDLKLQTCKNPQARFLIDNDFKYEFVIDLLGSKKAKTVRKELQKSFCVAGELPFINQQAIDDRYSMVRYWPNGERVDIRLVEKLTGTFQLLVAKFKAPDVPDKDFFVADLAADGLMLSISLKQKYKKGARLSKFWRQVVKGQSLEKNCVSVSQLAALTIGAVYSYRVEIYSDTGTVDSTVYTISYPDCLLYNRKSPE